MSMPADARARRRWRSSSAARRVFGGLHEFARWCASGDGPANPARRPAPPSRPARASLGPSRSADRGSVPRIVAVEGVAEVEDRRKVVAAVGGLRGQEAEVDEGEDDVAEVGGGRDTGVRAPGATGRRSAT